MNDVETMKGLKIHLKELTVNIGNRSIRFPENIEKIAEYIEAFYKDIGIPVHREPYKYRNIDVANIVAELSPGEKPAVKHYLLGAHYDTVSGTPGADDNASAIAVQLETARQLRKINAANRSGINIKFVSFVLEEPPAFGTRFMGSRVYAKKARKEKEQIDGMICLEMVGYTCHKPGCQDYPFPLMFMGYPEQGDFIGIVGDYKSRKFTRTLYSSFQDNPGLPVVKLTVPSKGWLLPPVRLSDHASFWDNGFKAVMITDTAFFRNPHYHRASDTMNTLDFRFMAELVNSLVLFFNSGNDLHK
ncbi:M28 family peptidase [Desulfonema limicola]|nr:M28 family peptidase [Desulfonema limicola]